MGVLFFKDIVKIKLCCILYQILNVKKIQVQSLPLYEVIRDIAEAFGSTYDENCGEYHLNLPENIGKGFIKGINFDGGFGILIYQCTFFNDVEIQFNVNKTHPLKFLYCLNGELSHRFQDGEELNTINQYQSAIVASKNYNGHILHFKANTETQIGSLEIDREQFQEKVRCELSSLHPELKKLFTDHKATNQFYYSGDYSLYIADLFKRIEEFENNDFVRRIFLEGQAYEILTNQIIQYHDDHNDSKNRSLLRRSELDIVKNAASIIENSLNDLETIDVMAENLGINVNKLQHGFKYLYGCTVNMYIQKQRLDLAKTLLTKTDFNISEIVERIGLSSKSYFSKVFKEMYSISPSEFRSNHKNRTT